MSRGWSDSTDAPTWTASETSDPDPLGGIGDLSMRRIGWRRQALLAAGFTWHAQRKMWWRYADSA